MRVVVMGVTGCGKTSVGEAIAAERGCPFVDGDDFHPAQNIAKMSAGTPLTDDDRWPWLDAVGEWLAAHPDAVVACSALRRSYRDRLRERAGAIVFIHLAAQQSVIAERVRIRSAAEGHFAGVELLASQYAALEPLGFDEVGGTIDVSRQGLNAIAETAVDIVSMQDD